jgi:hypothetical protein
MAGALVARGAQRAPVFDDARLTRLGSLSRTSVWTLTTSAPMRFDTFHPQGMVKIGDTFIVSSVDKAGHTGHLFKIDKSGNLVGDLRLKEGEIYHPGGIDYDGRDIWVPLAEYRPDSRSILYRVNPATLKATEVLRFADHVGAVVHNTDDHTLHGVSWGSRRFYRWTLDSAGRVTNASVPPERLRTLNPSHYIDYQDCKYIGGRRMLCGGVAELAGPPSARGESPVPFRLGGLEVISLVDGRPLHQVPVLLWTISGVSMTQNPIWVEPAGTGLRAYFMPEDNRSTLYVYEVSVARP